MMNPPTEKICLGGLFLYDKAALLFFVIPPRRVFVDVFYVLFLIFLVSDNMVVKIALPNIFAVLLIAKPF